MNAQLYYKLTNTAGITAQVGSTGVYIAGRVPEGVTGKYLTYQLISNPRDYYQSGASGLNEYTYQFNCVGDSPDDSWAVRDAVVTALNAYRGSMGAAGSTVDVRVTTLVSNRDSPLNPSDGSAYGAFTAILEFQFIVKE